MKGRGEEEAHSLLADHRIDQLGIEVKLDKGFAEGTYCGYLEFDVLAGRVGFAAARRLAGEYCALLKSELSRAAGYAVGETEDASRSADPRRRRDLEATFLSFPVEAEDGRFHDRAMKELFRLAFLRAGQAWDQSQARVQTQRRHGRRENFRRQLAELLDGGAYGSVDAAVKERLLAEVPALAFPPRGVEP